MITIAAYTIGQTTTYPGDSCTLELTSNQSFTASDGTGVMASTPQNGSFIVPITCPINGSRQISPTDGDLV